MPDYQPVNPTNCTDRFWQLPTHFMSARTLGHIPLSPREVYPAAAVMPIGFAQVGQRVEPVAITGQHADVNLFVGPQGQWLGRYIPAQLRLAPFRLIPDGKGQGVLCVDQNSEWFSSFDGNPFFESGKPSAVLQSRLDELRQWTVERGEPLAQIITALQHHDLLTPWPLTFTTPDGQTVRHEGLLQVNNGALQALSASALAELHQVHALPMLYAQRLSTFHLNLLDRLAAAHAQASPSATPVADIEALFGAEDETLKFNF